MGGIKLLGSVRALWGNISQERGSAASHHPAAGSSWQGASRAAAKPLRALKGLRNPSGNLPRLLLEPCVKLWPKDWHGSGCAVLKSSSYWCAPSPLGCDRQWGAPHCALMEPPKGCATFPAGPRTCPHPISKGRCWQCPVEPDCCCVKCTRVKSSRKLGGVGSDPASPGCPVQLAPTAWV